MRQKVITNQKAQKHKVVNNTFLVKTKRNLRILELKSDVLPDNGNLDILELDRSFNDRLVERVVVSALVGHVTHTFALVTVFVFGLHESLSENIEIWLVSRQTQHDQISVRAVDAVAQIGVVAGLAPLRTDKLQDFVLAFPRDRRV